MQKKLLINIRAVEKKHSYGHNGIAMKREMLEKNLGKAVKVFFEIKNDKEITFNKMIPEFYTKFKGIYK